MTPIVLSEAIAAMQASPDNDARFRVLADAAGELDPVRRPEEFELAATALAVASPSTLEIVEDTLRRTDETNLRFLAFAMGAIGCRRANERLKSRELFRGADYEFRQIPLFQHFEAVSLDQGSLRELRRAVGLERRAYDQLHPHAGCAHALASLTAQLVELGGLPPGESEAALREAHDLVTEALQARERYAKFFFTRGTIERQLGRFDEARDSLLRAVELEDRASVDAGDRLRDYRLQLALVGVEKAMRSLNDESRLVLADLERRTDAVASQVSDTAERLRDAEVGMITAVAFVASAIALVQVAVGSFGDRPFLEVIGILASFGAVLFGAVAYGSRSLRGSAP